jgi:hypothetical protein
VARAGAFIAEIREAMDAPARAGIEAEVTR